MDRAYLKTLGGRIRSLRKANGLSQIEVSYRCEIDRSNYHRIESGNTNPTVTTLKKIADAIGVPVRDFFTFD